jgi:hypothetical protein
MEQHDLRLIDGDSIDRIREVRILPGEDGRCRGDIEGIGIVVLVGERCVVTQTVSVIEKGLADLYVTRGILRRGFRRFRF